MNETTPKPEINEVAYEDYMATELSLEEVADPDHLDDDDRVVLENMVDAHRAGIIGLPDDPTIRAYVNGSILWSLGHSVAEPGYDYQSVESSELPKELQEALTEEKFQLAVKAAQELDPNLEIPEDLRERFLAELRSWGPERLAEICSEMEKPTINIVPSNSFNDKVAQMDRNKHYEGQNDTFVVEGDDEPYRNVKTVSKVRVFLDDGKPKPSQIDDAPFGLEKRRKFEAKRTGDKNMDFAGPHRIASLLQQSLIEAEQTGDMSKIIDSKTVTVLNSKNLTDSKYVACARFDPRAREVNFYSNNPGGGADIIRGRASVQVLEF